MNYSGHSRFRRLRASGVLPHHQHAEAHIAVVLSGGYEEAGDRGCFRVKPGDVLLHSPFESHVNRYEPRGADLITLELAASATITEAVATLPDADEIVRIAECDPREATAEVLRVMQPAKRSRRRLATKIGDRVRAESSPSAGRLGERAWTGRCNDLAWLSKSVRDTPFGVSREAARKNSVAACCCGERRVVGGRATGGFLRPSTHDAGRQSHDRTAAGSMAARQIDSRRVT